MAFSIITRWSVKTTLKPIHFNLNGLVNVTGLLWRWEDALSMPSGPLNLIICMEFGRKLFAIDPLSTKCMRLSKGSS